MDRATWWEGRFWPDALEVVGWRESVRLTGPTTWASAGVPTGTGGVGRAAVEGSSERAARRARGKLRRYAVANKLTRMITLTTAHQSHDERRVKREFRSFVKRGLRVTLGYRGAYAIGFERHRSGAVHAHVLVGGYLPQAALERAWGHGFVFVQRFGGRGGREAARSAAGYLAKYVGKSFDEGGMAGGLHRYEVAQGFTVRQVRVFALSARGLAEACCDVVEAFWFAPAVAGRGPPVMWAALGAGAGILEDSACLAPPIVAQRGAGDVWEGVADRSSWGIPVKRAVTGGTQLALGLG